MQGPGCASLQYLTGDRLAVSMSFGERVLTNTTISSKTLIYDFYELCFTLSDS